MADPKAEFESAESSKMISEARVAELADAPDLGSGGEIRRGSSPLSGSLKGSKLSLHGIVESFRKYPELARNSSNYVEDTLLTHRQIGGYSRNI